MSKSERYLADAMLHAGLFYDDDTSKKQFHKDLITYNVFSARLESINDGYFRYPKLESIKPI